MTRRSKIWFIIFWLSAIGLSYVSSTLIAGCETSEPTEEFDLTARYQNDDYAMILLLEHNYKNVSAVLEWTGYTTTLEGKFDKLNKQVIMSGNYFGNQNISFNLFYGTDKSLAGQFVYNGQYSPIKFRFVNKLFKHNQGSLYSQ